LLDCLVIGQHAAQPSVIDIRRAAAHGFFLDDFARLALGTDEENGALVGGEPAHEFQRLQVLFHRLLEVDDVDLVAMAEDVRCHPRVPVAGLMPEVDPGFEHFTHRDRHVSCLR
jgi:hypothetical protein